MFIVCRDTVANHTALETRSLPKKFFGRVQLVPRHGGIRLWVRLLIEMQFLRYISALLPFIAMPFLFQELALPITQAPLAMLVVIGVVELKILRLSTEGRKKQVSEEEAARRSDRMRFRAKAVLRSLAARRGIEEGTLRLVIEQSELARVAPLTFVSVQTDRPSPHLLELSSEERQTLEDELFDQDLTERQWLAVCHRQDSYIHEIRQEAQAVSAHARLSAYLDQRSEQAEAI